MRKFPEIKSYKYLFKNFFLNNIKIVYQRGCGRLFLPNNLSAIATGDRKSQQNISKIKWNNSKPFSENIRFQNPNTENRIKNMFIDSKMMFKNKLLALSH